jgi:hypothetical protein
MNVLQARFAFASLQTRLQEVLAVYDDTPILLAINGIGNIRTGNAPPMMPLSIQ